MNTAARPMSEVMMTASTLAGLLRLLARAHEDLQDLENQTAVGWLLPVAERMAADIAAIAEDELNRPIAGAGG